MKLDIQNPKVNSRLVLWSYLLILFLVAPIGRFCWDKWHSWWAFAPLAASIILWVPWAGRLDRIRLKRYEEMRKQHDDVG